MPFQCSICDEPSTRICVRCTKDACDNHICEKCLKCSDCCECEVALNATPRIAPTIHTPPEPEPEPGAEGESVPEAEYAEAAETEPEAAPLAEPPVSDEPTPDPIALAETHPPDQTDIPQPIPEGE